MKLKVKLSLYMSFAKFSLMSYVIVTVVDQTYPGSPIPGLKCPRPTAFA